MLSPEPSPEARPRNLRNLGGVGWGVEDGLAAGAAIEHVVDDAAKIDAKSAGHGVGLAGKTRRLSISEPRSFLAEMAYDPVVPVVTPRLGILPTDVCHKQLHRFSSEIN
jgi:hypothetical protein